MHPVSCPGRGAGQCVDQAAGHERRPSSREPAGPIGGVEPGYCVMALGGRQPGCERVAQVMNTVLKGGDRVFSW